MRFGAVLTASALVLSGLATLSSLTAATPAYAENSTDAGGPSWAPGTYHAYVADGEHLDVSFTPAADSRDQHIVVTDPSGVVQYDCTATPAVPCVSPDLTGPAGAWKIENTPVDAAQGSTNWRIEVSNGTTVQTGRVWTDRATITQFGGANGLQDLTFYLVNDAGYQYTVDLRQYNGILSAISANSLGVTDADCVPTYHSSEADRITGFPVAPNRQDCEPQYRVFFDQPSAALPATAPSSDGRLNVLPAPLATSDLDVDDLAFTPSSPNSASGTFNYSINPRFSGAYELQVDTNGNGTYDDPEDRSITLGADGSGQYSYDFDGLDGQGNPIADCTLMNARIFFNKLGEMHVLQSDVEGRTGGITVTRTNGPGAPDPTIYWDDTNLANDRTNTTPVTDGTAGVDSTAGVHGWDFSNNSWGNNRVIDDWTYVPVNVGTGEISVGGLCYTVAKAADKETAAAGETVNYTVTVTSTGTGDYTAENPAKFTDDLSGVLDDATYNGDAAVSYSGSSTAAAPTVDGNTLSWSGALTAGEVATITYSITVNSPDIGDHELHNVVTTPGTCAPGDCETTTLVPEFTFQKTSDTVSAVPGDTVGYTVTVTNTGKVDYTTDEPASFTDDMSDVLDDATYNDDASNGATVDGNTLSWSGPLAVGQSVKVTYSVTVNTPDTGDQHLVNRVGSDNPTGRCTTEGGCETDTPVGSYTVTKTVDATKAAEGDTVGYTVTVTNTGAAAYTAEKPASFTDDMSDVLDDATYNKDASNGATVDGKTLSWSGPLAVGQSVKVTYSVTVNTPDTGNRHLGNVVVPTGPGGDCSGTCTTDTPVDPVPPAVAGSTPSGLALTGTEPVGLGIALALLLLALGGAGLVFGRRSRQAAGQENV